MGGIVLAASYMLWTLQRVVLGQVSSRMASLLPDLNAWEIVTLAPLAIIVFGVGVYPGPFVELLDASVAGLVEHLRASLPLTDSPGT